MLRAQRRLFVSVLCGVIVGAPVANVTSADCTPSATTFCPPEVRPFDGPNGPSSSQPTTARPANQQPTAAQPANQQPAAPAQGNAVSQPILQGNASTSAAAAVLSVDPPSAPVGATVTVTARGLGAGRSVWVNLAEMKDNTGLRVPAKQLLTLDGALASPVTGPDGSLNAKFVIPKVPAWTQPDASICVLNATVDAVCTSFTIAGSNAPAVNTATTPDAILGHYMCSSYVIIGKGGEWCPGTFPMLVLNGDNTYTWGDAESGTWDFDGSTVTFSGSLGSGSIMNRNLTVETQVTEPDGSTIDLRLVYSRLDY
jgi:hypothetical protein